MGTLFLIPNTLGDTALETVIPSEVLRKIAAINTFASENPSNTRAFLKRITPQRTMDTVTFLEVNEHSTPEDYQACLEALARHDVGIISEAGSEYLPETNFIISEIIPYNNPYLINLQFKICCKIQLRPGVACIYIISLLCTDIKAHSVSIFCAKRIYRKYKLARAPVSGYIF